MSKQLMELLRCAQRPRILVVGDVMLDKYLWGDVDRISPEAQIPLLRVQREEHRLGGAGSVVAMLAALGAEVHLVTVLGDDPEAKILRRLLGEIGVADRAVLQDPRRTTTVKQRMLGRTHSRFPQQVLRIDREYDAPLGAPIVEELLEAVDGLLGLVDLVLVSDYAKGVCAGEFTAEVVARAARERVAVVADPVREGDYGRYAGCTCITPNRTEAAMALDMPISTPEEALQAARRMLDFGVDSVAVTLDRDGIAWADRRGNARVFPVQPRQVYDITGAGDMVLSALGYCLAVGADWTTAVEMANLAGGMEVERLGVVPIAREELLGTLTQQSHTTTDKIVSLDQLLAELQRRRAAGETIAMTNGCFDLLHPGHVASIEAARALGDLLVVGLNSDRSVEQLKGPGHPIVDQRGRAEMLASLACVDYVVLFDQPSVAGLIEQVLPDVLVKADQYAPEEIVGHQTLERHGGRVVRVPMRPGYSSSRLIEKIRQQSVEQTDESLRTF